MSKKKNANIERNIKKKQERQALHQKLENFIVKNTGIVLILAVLFTVFGNYKNVFTSGMPVLFNILIWAGVAAVLVFAILGYVKKNPALYKWCAYGAANSVIWYIFMSLGANFGTYTSGVAHSYYAIALYFIFCLAYYFLAYYGVWEKKAVRIIFYVLAVLSALTWLTTASVFLYKQVAPYI
ncbi:MAG: hypothetical protein IJD97_07355 [Clostridia bacterium]|nr:hypothetical protein [Clostridia bacterium]